MHRSPRPAKGPCASCARGCVWVCVSAQCVPRMPGDPAGEVRKTPGLAAVLPVNSGAPEHWPTLAGPWGQPLVVVRSEVGAARSRQASTCPVDAASPLYYLAYPQRKSLQIPSFLPAAVRPPPGSGAKEWNLTLPLPHLPPFGTGLGGPGCGGIVGGCRWLMPSVEPSPSCGGLWSPPQPGLEGGSGGPLSTPTPLGLDRGGQPLPRV